MANLFQAIESDDPQLVLKLLEDGANANHVSHQDGFRYQTPLHCAIRRQKSDIVKILLKYGANSNRRTFGYLWSPFNLAISGSFEIIDLLIECGAKVNTDGECKITPLHRATTFERVDVIKKLIENGADVNAEDGEGKTAIYRASLTGNVEILELLIQNGANVNPNNYFVSPLNCAVRKQNEKIVKILLENGANVNYQLEKSKTALNSAIETANTTIICLLLDHGADVNMSSLVYDCSNRQKLPLEYSRTLNHTECTHLLMAYMMKLLYLNKYVSKENLSMLSEELDAYGSDWKTEIEKLKTEIICDSYIVSFLDILVKRTNILIFYFRNADIKAQLKEINFTEKCFLFSTFMNYRLKKVLEMTEIFERGETITRIILNSVYILPDVCIRKICNYIGFKEMKILVDFYKI